MANRVLHLEVFHQPPDGGDTVVYNLFLNVSDMKKISAALAKVFSDAPSFEGTLESAERVLTSLFRVLYSGYNMVLEGEDDRGHAAFFVVPHTGMISFKVSIA